jgi:hypothetical protein
MRRFIREIINIIYLTKSEGYLNATGWLKSIYTKKSVDKRNNPIPWMTYPFFDFINERLSNDFTLFEYGSGNSTLYWAKRLKKVISVEHDIEWYEMMRKIIPCNVNYRFVLINENYANSIALTEEKFDIIVIDGRKRVECAKIAPKFLNSAGIIIWDNSFRMKYKEGINFLEKEGYKHIDFAGLNPLGNVKTVTSVFYKHPNCLNI